MGACAAMQMLQREPNYISFGQSTEIQWLIGTIAPPQNEQHSNFISCPPHTHSLWGHGKEVIGIFQKINS